MENYASVQFESLTESQKLKKENIQAKVNNNISIALSKFRNVKRAYDLRHGIRDTEQFDHITKKYGVEFPANLTHTPLIDRHVKVLEGEMEELPLNYRISCMDKDSLNKVTQERTQERKKALVNQVDAYIKESLKPSQQSDPLSEEEIAKIENHYTSKWKSNLEINTQHVLNYELQNLKFKSFSDKTFSDVTTSGEQYYVSKIVADGKQHWFRRLDPRNILYVKPSAIEMLADCDMVVYREKLSVTEILSRWGNQIPKEDRDKLKDNTALSSDFIILGDTPAFSDTYLNDQLQIGSDNHYVDVYYTEWKSVNKVGDKFRKDLYEGVRIGSEIFVDCGMYKYTSRNPDCPNDVKLNFNGHLYDEYDGKARSMFLDTEDVQNEYDIYNFHLDNAIALSGNKVQTVILENIPLTFGNDETERLLKHQEYTKHGFNYVSLTQEGAKEFNNYGQAVDLSLGGGVKTIVEILGMLEQRASMITGVSAAQMGEVSPYAGQGQTKLVVNRSSLVVRKLFSTHFKFCQAALTSILNNCKILYPKGFKGAYVVGGDIVEFSVDTEIENAYFGVFVSSDIFEWKAVEDYKQMSIQLAGQDKLDVVDSVDIYSSKSMTEIKQKLTDNLIKKKQDKTQEMQQQLEQASKQIQELTSKVEAFDQSKVQIEKDKLAFDREKLTKDIEIRQKELDELIQSNADMKEIKLKQLELEQLQITFSPASKEVKNI